VDKTPALPKATGQYGISQGPPLRAGQKTGLSAMAQSQPAEVDVAVVGAGFAGLYLLRRLRNAGMTARCFEAGSDVGGTWYWNRYPGARCDVESMQYSYSFSPELEQEWKWTELFASQPEILRYAQHVADRFDLRRDIQFNTRVTDAAYSEATGRWSVRTDHGDIVSSRFCVMATGCLSAGRLPEIPGIEDFKGPSYHTGEWPHEGVDFTNLRVAVIGTGSSAIQAIPEIAKQASCLVVFQRTPNYSIPARNGPMTADYEASWKTVYPERRETARYTRSGTIYDFGTVSALEVSDEEREREYRVRWKKGGANFMSAFNDIALNEQSNHTMAEFVRARIKEMVRDERVADMLTPRDYPIGTKRICIDSSYFETFNQLHVSLVDIKANPIESIVANGVQTRDELFEVDAIVYATGFDAMTGALSRIAVAGRNNQALTEKWSAGPRTLLGLMTAGFPNLFMVTGPGSPSVLSNMMVSIEQHVEWITDCLTFLNRNGLTTIEPEQDAEDEWVAHVNDVAHGTLYPRAASWYMGANVAGKPRVFLPYIGGVGLYRQRCADIAQAGYSGFRFDRELERATQTSAA
jgi:cyclohexanone monooxygenase